MEEEQSRDDRKDEDQDQMDLNVKPHGDSHTVGDAVDSGIAGQGASTNPSSHTVGSANGASSEAQRKEEEKVWIP